jgi:hypothetical protein
MNCRPQSRKSLAGKDLRFLKRTSWDAEMTGCRHHECRSFGTCRNNGIGRASNSRVSATPPRGIAIASVRTTEFQIADAPIVGAAILLRGVVMDTRIIFGLSVLMGFIAFGLATKRYLWPRLRSMERDGAIAALLTFHAFRFIGLSFVVPGVVSPALPPEFAVPAAYGDLVAAVLAIAGFIALARRARWATALLWLFNIWGTADLLLAFVQGGRVGLDAGMLGATFFIPTAIVPALLITHGLIFRLLVRANQG